MKIIASPVVLFNNPESFGELMDQALEARQYCHRHIGLGSWDSTCPDCAVIAANATTEAGLSAGEDRHTCESPFLPPQPMPERLA